MTNAAAVSLAKVPAPLVSPLPPPGRRQRRFGAASEELLAEAGYVEEEFFITGTGNIYTYAADGSVEVKAVAVPYTTQLLVRRPADPDRFSGTTILEPTHRAGAWGMTYCTCWDYFTERGDAWAQVLPGRFHAMTGPLVLDPTRYAPLNLSDEGQLWDVLAQVGQLLKSDAPENPLPGTKQLFMTGTSGTSLMVLTFLGDGFHERHRLSDGAPIYDGYLPYAAHSSLTYYRICSPPRGINGAGEITPHPSEQIPFEDPRRTVHGHDVPVMQVVTEAEVIIPFDTPPVSDLMINMYNNGLPVSERLRYRREDSDDPADLYRLYEIAGSGHDSSLAETTQRTLGLPKAPNLRMGRPRGPLSSYPIKYPLAAAFELLRRWAADGIAPPRAERIAVDESAVKLVRDERGNAVGGLRSTYVDVPLSRYTGVNPGAALMGSEEPLDTETLRNLYGDHAGYLNKVEARSETLVDEGWLLQQHRDAVIAEAQAKDGQF